MKKLIITYLIALSVLTIGSVLALRICWPEHYPAMLYLIPLFYALMLGVMIWLKRANEKKGKDRSIFFLSYRIVKILLAIVLLLVYFTAVGEELLLVYFTAVGEELLTFAVVFAVFYLCLSMVETTLFIKGEKKS